MKKTKRIIIVALFAIYCLALVYLLFLNNGIGMRCGLNGFGFGVFSKEHLHMCNFVPFRTIGTYFDRWVEDSINLNYVILNLFGNLILFAPMGFFIPVLFAKKINKFWKFLIVILVLVILAEVIQFLTFMGSSDIDDVILNTCGACIAYGLVKIPVIDRYVIKKLTD